MLRLGFFPFSLALLRRLCSFLRLHLVLSLALQSPPSNQELSPLSLPAATNQLQLQLYQSSSRSSSLKKTLSWILPSNLEVIQKKTRPSLLVAMIKDGLASRSPFPLIQTRKIFSPRRILVQSLLSLPLPPPLANNAQLLHPLPENRFTNGHPLPSPPSSSTALVHSTSLPQPIPALQPVV